MSRKQGYSKEQLEEAVKNSTNLWQVLQRLVSSPSAGHYPALRKRLSEWKISTDHFASGRGGWNKGRRGDRRPRQSLESILVKGSTYTNRSCLKARLVEAGLKEEKCVECGLSPEWRGRKLVLQLDHINGDSTDNRLENLRFLCPNCHSQTDTFCSRNRDSIRRKSQW